MAQIRAVLDQIAVREAESYLLENHKKPTYSNISVITGIQRRRVARLLSGDAVTATPPNVTALHRAVRVLNGWHEDPALRVKGDGRTFESLAKRYAGGVGPAAILDRLIETRTIEVLRRDPQGRPTRVRPLQDTIGQDVKATRSIDEFGTLYAEALDMLDRNLRTSNSFERMRPYTVTATVEAPQLRFIRRQLSDRGEAVEALLDEVLAPHDVAGRDASRFVNRDPKQLFAVRVTMFTTVRPAQTEVRSISGSWRRDVNGGDA
jgi:hypothetical protein